MKQLELKEIVKKQFVFKLKTYHNLIGSLLLFQLIALFFSLFGQMSSMTMDLVTVTNNIYSADVIISFTLLWIFVMSFYIKNRSAENMMYIFIVDKLSNHLADFLFMFVLSLLGSITSVLLGVGIRAFIILYYGVDMISFIDYFTMSDLLFTLLIAFLYHLLVFSIGYVIAGLIQLHKSFIVLVPLFLFSLFVLSVNITNTEIFFSFFVLESDIIVFFVKVLCTVIISWIFAFYIGRRLEVRKR